MPKNCYGSIRLKQHNVHFKGANMKKMIVENKHLTQIQNDMFICHEAPLSEENLDTGFFSTFNRLI